MSEKFTSPVTNTEVIGFHRNESGDVDRATLLITDAHQRLFGLTVETAREFTKRLFDEAEQDAEEQEPVFVLPAKSVDAAVIAEVLTLPGHLLNSYLVPQDESEGRV